MNDVTMKTVNASYEIAECNLDNFYAGVEKLNRRALKLGVPSIVLRKNGIIRTEDVTRRQTLKSDLHHFTPEQLAEVVSVKRWVGVDVSGETPRFAGWELSAVVERTDAGNLLRKSPKCAVELSQYRDSVPCCDHCKLVRNRRDTYIVSHEDGTVKQVGANCLRDFLGHTDPHILAARAELMYSLSELCEGSEDAEFFGEGGSSTRDLLNVSTFLSYVTCARRHKGFITSAKARELEEQGVSTSSTAERAIMWMVPPDNKYGAAMPKPEAADREFAATTQEWVLDFLGKRNPETLSDFEHNMLTIARATAVEFRNKGLAAFLVEFRCRELDKEITAKAEKASYVDAHFGTVKTRYRDESLVYVRSTGWDSEFGYTYLHTFRRQESGEALVWKTGTELSYTPGEVFKATFTVKEHGEFRGQKQTKITRLK